MKKIWSLVLGPPHLKNASAIAAPTPLELYARKKNVKIMPSPTPFKFVATPLSAVYQHFSKKGSKFRIDVAVNDSQDCDSIIPLHFCLLFANYL